jgi:hypothetical protein
VSDGAGTDIDYTIDLHGYAANWQSVDWAKQTGMSSGEAIRYEVALEYWDASSWQPVAGAGGRLSALYPNTPATSFSGSARLDRGTRYRVSVVAVHEDESAAGAGTTVHTSAPAYSDGFWVVRVGSIDPPTAVRDGPGSDIDTTNDTGGYAVNWQAPDWAAAGATAGDRLRYGVYLEYWNGSAWQDVNLGGGSTATGVYPDAPPTSFSSSYQLTYDREYRVGVSAFISEDESGFEGSSAVAYSDGFLVRPGADAALTASPAVLQFREGQNEKQIELTIQATGAGSITVTELTLEKRFSDSTTVSAPIESLTLSVPGGSDRTITRTLALSAFDRVRALGGSQSGNFIAAYRVTGQDPYGYPVDAVADVTVSVSSEPASSLQVSGVELELPPSPYYVGDLITNARVRVLATGSGMVSGEVLVDGQADWTDDNAFSVTVSGETVFDIQGELPTDGPGDTTVTVEITDPSTHSDDATYSVSDQTPPFPPQVLTLVPDVAELTDFDGTAQAVNNSTAGYEEFTFNGTASMKLLSLENTELSEVTVTDLVVRYDNDDPTKPKIRGGTVEKESEGEETFVTVTNDHLKIKKVYFQGQKSPATDHILVDAKLAVPKLGGREIMMVEGLVVKTEGVEAKSFSFQQSDPKSFEAFGMEFRIHDVDGISNALVFGEDSGNDRHYFSLSGSIAMESKKGTQTKTDTLTTFKDLTFFTDGHIDGVITFSKSFDLIPDILEINTIKLKNIDESWKLKLAGELKGLPKPLTALNETEFEITFDKDGNASGGLVPLKELEKDQEGHELGESDDNSEWELGIGTLDATYLEFVFEYQDGTLNRDFSEIRIGMDFYLDLQTEGGGEADDSGRRISFGELNANGDFEGGVRLNMEGEFDWHSPTNAQVLQDKQLALPGINLAMDSLAVQTEPEFGLAMSGSIVMGMSGVSGGVGFENLVLSVDGSISNLSEAVVGGEFEVAGSLKVEVDEIDWSTEPTSLSFESNETTGEGANKAPEKGSRQVDVESYLRLENALVNVGSVDDPVMSGGCDEFTFYDAVNGGRSFVVRGASLETADLELTADVAYTEDLLTLAGSMSIPGDTIEASVVGTFGRRNGDFTMGVFVAVSGLNMMVSPAVFLDGIGGGFFVNPIEDDMAMVRRLAGFERPELSSEITAKRPGGEANPGSCALMLLGDFYVTSKDFLNGRALLTLTANYFNLDAEASYAADTVEGCGYLAVGWDPAYAEGNLELELDFLSILKGEGNLDFYVYASDTWAVNGSYNLYLYSKSSSISSGELFVGPPGLMVNASVSQGVDWRLISGSVTFEGMFWYWAQTSSSRFGVYAAVTAEGELLNLVSGRASLEGALIATPSLLIYSTGSVRLKVLGRTVWSGSMWVSAGAGGLNGGTGPNDAYDQMIADARSMADEMESTKDELLEDMEAARLELLELSPEQLAAAGLILVEPEADLYATWIQAFDGNELDYWSGPLPEPLATIRSRLFGPQQQQLAVRRSELAEQRGEVDAGIGTLEQLQTRVVESFAEYEDLLLEDLPQIDDLGIAGSPVRGYETETITVNGTTKTVRVGFDLDERKAEQQGALLATLREEFAAYQDAFIDRAGRVDHVLRQLDRILYRDDANLSELSARYAEQYRAVSGYLRTYIDQQLDQKEYADESVTAIRNATDAATPSIAQPNGAEVVESINQQKASTLSAQELGNWLSARQHLLDLLVDRAGLDPQPLPEGTSEEQAFVRRGTQLWWEIPMAGFQAMWSGSTQRLESLDAVFGQSLRSFRATWSNATTLTDRVYERKAALYALLHEIYDQLARYGTGDIGILSSGGAAGFAGAAGSGLGFRTPSAAAEISAQAFTLPADAETQGATTSVLRPAIEVVPGETEPDVAAGISFFGGSGAYQAAQLAVPPAEWQWVPVRAYFRAKRREITPYLDNPVFTTYDGTVRSDDQYSADVAVEFAADHPITVVEYSWNLTEAAATQEPTDESGSAYSPYIVSPGEIDAVESLLADEEDEPANDGGGFLGLFGPAPVETEIGFQLFIPWFSVGASTVLEDILTREEFAPGEYALSVRARGAGGTHIIRRATIELDYFDPAADGAAYSSRIDPRDDTPPSTPQVALDGPYSGRTDSIYASWTSSDRDSGIQRFEYAVVPYDEVRDLAEGARADLPVADLPVADLPGGNLPSTGLPSAAGTQLGGATEQAAGSAPTGSNDAIPYGAAQAPLPSAAGRAIELLVEDDPRFEWRSAQSLTEMNIRDLDLEHGEEYAVVIRAVNGAGLSSIGASAPVMIDTTPPLEPSITEFSRQTIAGKPGSFRVTVGELSDPESGIAEASFALGTTEGADDLLSWTALDAADAIQAATTLGVVDLPLSDGREVYLTVRAVNRARASAQSTESAAVRFTDSTPPEPVEASIRPEHYTADPTTLTVGWSASADDESGVFKYEFGLGTDENSPDVTGWTELTPRRDARVIGLRQIGGGDTRSGAGMGPAGTRRREDGGGGKRQAAVRPAGSAVIGERRARADELEAAYRRELTDLSLQHGESYYLLVRAINGAGLASVSSAGPVTADTTPPVEAEVRELTVGPREQNITLELLAEDPESGIAAFRWQVVRDRAGAADSVEVVADSGWTAVAGAGTKPTVKRQIAASLRSAARGGTGSPRVRVFVANGAGLEVEAGSWPDTGAGGDE